MISHLFLLFSDVYRARMRSQYILHAFLIDTPFCSGTVCAHAKTKERTDHHSRAAAETRATIEQLSHDNLITLGDALDLLVRTSPKRPPRPEKERSNMSRISFQFPSHLAEQVRAHAARLIAQWLDSATHVLATG